MYSDKVRKTTLLVAAVIVAALIAAGLALWAVKAGERNLSEESSAALTDTILRSARQCYVVEGVYPPDLAYLEENYGLQINHRDFYVTYDAFAENLPPTVRVSIRK